MASPNAGRNPVCVQSAATVRYALSVHLIKILCTPLLSLLRTIPPLQVTASDRAVVGPKSEMGGASYTGDLSWYISYLGGQVLADMDTWELHAVNGLQLLSLGEHWGL